MLWGQNDLVLGDCVERRQHHLRVVLPGAGLLSGLKNVYGG